MIGVYLLKKKGRVVYVGKSTNVARRIGQHGDKKFDSHEVLECCLEELDSLEIENIKKYDPILNKSHSPSKKKDEKIDMRIDTDVKEFLKGVADERGQSLSEFVLESAVKKAKRLKSVYTHCCKNIRTACCQ